MTDNLINIEINGKPYEAKPGSMIIEVADKAGLLIPRFCYHKRLSVAANCRMCLVEVEKAPKPLPACATPVMDGMKVSTKSPLAMQAQKSVMEFLLINHPLDCPICDQGGECELQDVAMGYGSDLSRFNERKRVVKDKDLGPLVATDMTRCIHCTRCVRFGEEIAGLPELGSTGRGEDLKIGTFIERNMESELSGNVIDVCPVGALTSKPFRFRARAWEIAQHAALSPHDGVGSNLYVHVKHDKVVRVVPRENEAINESWISDRDRFSYQGLYSEDRLDFPQVKREGIWRRTDWEGALTVAAERLRQVSDDHGAEKLAAMCSPSATVEEGFLLQRLMRSLGSGNVDHRLRQSDFRDQSTAPAAPWLGQTLVSLASNDVTLLVGCDARREQPMLNHRLRKSVLNGGSVCVVNPLGLDFNYRTDVVMISSPAGMIRNLAGVVNALGVSKDSIAELLTGGETEPAHQDVANRLESGDRTAILLGSMAAAHPEAAVLRALAATIARASRSSLGYLNDGANAAGICLAGVLPHREAGGSKTPVEGVPVTGLLGERSAKGWITFGVEPELDCHDSSTALAALAEAEFCLCFASHDSEALRQYADVILPIAAFAENEGTLVNVEGRWQSFAATVPVAGDGRIGWKVLRVLANRLGIEGFDYLEAAQIRDEVKGRSPERLSPIDGEGTGSLQRSVPRSDGKVVRIGDVPIYAVDPLVRRAAALQATSHAAASVVAMSSDQAARLGLGHGDDASIRQKGGGARLRVVIDDRVPDGCVRVTAGSTASVGLGPAFGEIEVEKA